MRESSDEYVNVTEVWSHSPGTRMETEELKAIFAQCVFGDVLQTGIPHSMVYLDSDGEGIWVYDANFDLYTCKVNVHLLTWEQVARYVRSYGFSAYHAVNYPELLPDEPSLDCLYLPEKGLSESGGDLSGLVFLYACRDTVCTLSADSEGAFTVDDGVRSFCVEDPEAYGLKLEITAGETFDSGRLYFTFRGAQWESVEEVGVTSEGIIDFAPPSKTEYTVGEALCVEDAYMYIADPEKGRVFRFCDELEFSGFDSSKTGTCTVTMSADGWTADFAVTILPAPEPTESAPPSSTEKTPDSGGWIWWIVVPILILAGGLGGFFLFFRGQRAKRRKENEKKS